MSRLLYSTANADRRDLGAVPTPLGRGAHHSPYPYLAYVEDVAGALERTGYEILDEEFELSPDKQQFFGAMEITPKGEDTPDDYSLLVGLRGSHNQRIPRGMVLGERIMVCSNLCFSGSIGSFKTKQTTNIIHRLPKLISETVALVPAMAQERDDQLQAMKQRELLTHEAESLMVDVFRQGGLSAAQLGKAVREYDKPTYEDHAQYGPSVWLAYNAMTEALKPNGANHNHNLIADRTEVITRTLNNFTSTGYLEAA